VQGWKCIKFEPRSYCFFSYIQLKNQCDYCEKWTVTFCCSCRITQLRCVQRQRCFTALAEQCLYTDIDPQRIQKKAWLGKGATMERCSPRNTSGEILSKMNYRYFEYWPHEIPADNLDLKEETSGNIWRQFVPILYGSAATEEASRCMSFSM
jgi:hypothetical protein